MKDVTARNIGIFIVAATAVLVVAVAAVRLLRERLPHVEVDREMYPVAGLDLSSHNGVPDFDSIRQAGIDFVYLKASEGNTFRDNAFVRNYSSARRAGIKVGAYHFFRFDREGTRQAANFLDAIGPLKLDLPLAVDVEEFGNPAGIPTELVAERLRTMILALRNEGRRVVIYTNKQGLSRFVREIVREDGGPDLWICSFTNPPLSHEDSRLWQHSHVGTVPGIEGYADMNVFCGSREEWNKWLDCSLTQ